MLMPSLYREEHYGYLRQYLQRGEKWISGTGREVVGQRRDGSTFPCELAVGEGRLGDRRVFRAIVRDITERKQAEAALQRENTFMSSLLDTVGQSITERWHVEGALREREHQWPPSDLLPQSLTLQTTIHIISALYACHLAEAATGREQGAAG